MKINPIRNNDLLDIDKLKKEIMQKQSEKMVLLGHLVGVDMTQPGALSDLIVKVAEHMDTQDLKVRPGERAMAEARNYTNTYKANLDEAALTSKIDDLHQSRIDVQDAKATNLATKKRLADTTTDHNARMADINCPDLETVDVTNPFFDLPFQSEEVEAIKKENEVKTALGKFLVENEIAKLDEDDEKLDQADESMEIFSRITKSNSHNSELIRKKQALGRLPMHPKVQSKRQKRRLPPSFQTTAKNKKSWNIYYNKKNSRQKK